MTVRVFGYGSMMDAESAARAVGRPLGADDLVPSHLHGYRRTWSLKERVLAESLGREVTAVFLDLEPAPAVRVNGVVVEVSDAAFEKLKLREKNYDAVDVTARVEGSPAPGSGTKVYTFVSKPAHRVATGEPALFVMERYLEMVDRACRRLGPAFTRDYLASTGEAGYPRLPGRYTFVDPEQAKYV